MSADVLVLLGCFLFNAPFGTMFSFAAVNSLIMTSPAVSTEDTVWISTAQVAGEYEFWETKENQSFRHCCSFPALE